MIKKRRHLFRRSVWAAGYAIHRARKAWEETDLMDFADTAAIVGPLLLIVMALAMMVSAL